MIRTRYDGLAEFHDLFMSAVWDRIRPHLRVAFGSLGPGSTILDLGAGSGLGTRLLAAESAANIIAVEPSLVMRSMLLARVSDRSDLSRQVSVVAGAAPSVVAELDGPLDGFVCCHVLGHLTTAQRVATFRALAARLSPDAIGVVTFQGGSAAERPVDPDVTETRRIGRYDYRVSYRPATDRQTFVADYEVVAGERVIRRQRFVGAWEAIALPQLIAESKAGGLGVEPVDEHVAFLRRAGSTSG